MQASGIAAADTDAAVDGGSSSTADVDGRDGAGKRMERTVPSEQQDRSDNHQHQQTSSTPSGLIGESHGENGVICSENQRKMGFFLFFFFVKNNQDTGDYRPLCMGNMQQSGMLG